MVRNSGFFDTYYYTTNYPDIKNANVLPIWHYFEYGWKERRNPCPVFNTNFYLSYYPDVAQSGMNPLFHYLKYGLNEGREINIDEKEIAILRNGGIFDEEFYLETNPDVKDSGQDASTHFYYFGYKEGRAPCPNFNWEYYSR